MRAATHTHTHTHTPTNSDDPLCEITDVAQFKGATCFIMHVEGKNKVVKPVAECRVTDTRVRLSWTCKTKDDRSGCCKVAALKVRANVNAKKVLFRAGGYCMDGNRKDFRSLHEAVNAMSQGKSVYVFHSILKRRQEAVSSSRASRSSSIDEDSD